MSIYDDVVSELGRDTRVEQKRLTESMLVAVESNGVLLGNADTGIGKTLAQAITVRGALGLALDTDASARKVVVATSTLNLCRELQLELEMVGVDSALLLSYRNFVSPERVEVYIYENPSSAAELTALRDWSGTIDGYISEYGELPNGLKESQVCQTLTTRSDSYILDRAAALESNVIVTTHAMIACDIMQSGRILNLSDSQTTLIVDEADAFIDYLKGFNVTNFNIQREFSAARPLCISEFSDELAHWSEVAVDFAKKQTMFSADGRELALTILRGLSQSAKDCAKHDLMAEDRSVVSEIIDYVGWTLDTIMRNKDVAIGLTKVREEPTISIFNPYFSRLFGSYADLNLSSLIMLSGTLSVDHDIESGTQWVSKELKLERFCTESEIVRKMFSPAKFGSMSVSLHKTNTDMYQASSHKLSGDWLAESANNINKLQGKVLVITSSYEESDKLGELLTGHVIVHKKGEKLKSAIDDFKSTNRHSILLSPTAHTGISILNSEGRSVITDVVITRLGFTVPNDMLQVIEGSPEFPASKIKALRSIEQFDALNKVIRRIKQIIGRGIRHRDDEFSLHVLDKRFPEYSMIKGRNAKLRYSIPKRFDSEYRNAQIIKSTTASSDDVDLSLLY